MLKYDWMSFKRDEVDLVNSYNGKTYSWLNGESDLDQNILRLFGNVVDWRTRYYLSVYYFN